MKNINSYALMTLVMTSTVLVMSCQKNSDSNSGAGAPAATSTPVFTSENATLQCPAEFQTSIYSNGQSYNSGMMQTQQYPNYSAYQNGIPVQNNSNPNDLNYNLEANENGQICRTGFQQAYSLQDLCQKLVNNSLNMGCARQQRAEIYLQRCQPCQVTSTQNAQFPNGQYPNGQFPNYQIPGTGVNGAPNYSTPGFNPNAQQNLPNTNMPVVQQPAVQKDPNLMTVTCAISSIDLSGRGRGNSNRISTFSWNRTQTQSFDLPMASASRLGAVKLQLAPGDQNNGNTLILQVGEHRAAGTSLTSRIRVELTDRISDRSQIADCFLAGQSQYTLFGSSRIKGYACQVGASQAQAQMIFAKKSRKSIQIAESAEGRVNAQFGYVSRSEFSLDEKIGNKLSVKFVVPVGQPLVLGLGNIQGLTQSSYGAVCLPSDQLQ